MRIKKILNNMEGSNISPIVLLCDSMNLRCHFIIKKIESIGIWFEVYL
jgi:hypothetical protein